MIDKIHFSVNIIIYAINSYICILYYRIKSLDLKEYNLSSDYITKKEIMDQISLGYSVFLLIFCLIYVVIYQEIYGKDVIKDLFINIFYILLSTNMIYYNCRNFSVINAENNNFSKVFFDVPNYPLENIRFKLFFIQGLIILQILFTLVKEFISFYRGLKDFILSYFENGGRVFFFEVRHLIV